MLITTGILRRFSRLFAFTCILTRTIGSIQVGAQLSSTYESWLNLTCDFPSINVAASTTSVWKVSNYNANIRALSSSRIPVVLSNHSARSWPATSWNLQDMHRTGRWSNLFGVVSLPVKEYYLCNASSGSNVVRSEVSLFFSPQEGAESSSNIRHSATGSSASPSQIVNQMTMLEFLNNISTAAGEAYPQEAKAWPTRRFLYSTEFDSLVEELQLHNDTAWETLLIDESHCDGASPCTAPSATATNKGDRTGASTTPVSDTANTAPVDPADHPSPLLHLLHPGVALQSRLSEYHTLRVQLTGRGRYYLFPPQQAPHPLHVYPSVHQHAGQAQVDVYREGRSSNEAAQQQQQQCLDPDPLTQQQQQQQPDMKHPPAGCTPLFGEYAHNLASSSGGSGSASTTSTGIVRVAELQSGDVLYVPPYWSVHSEATTFSVLLDVLSVSLEQQLLAPAYFLELPFLPEQTRTKEQRVVAAQVLLVHVLSRVHGVGSVLKVAQALYHSRYAALYPENGLFLRKSKFQCLRDQPALYDSLVAKLDPQRVSAAAVFVAARVNSPFFAQGRPQSAAKWVWLGGYIEKLARWAMMGDGEQAVLFIRECLHMDRVLSVVEEVLGPDAVFLDPKEES